MRKQESLSDKQGCNLVFCGYDEKLRCAPPCTVFLDPGSARGRRTAARGLLHSLWSMSGVSGQMQWNLGTPHAVSGTSAPLEPAQQRLVSLRIASAISIPLHNKGEVFRSAAKIAML